MGYGQGTENRIYANIDLDHSKTGTIKICTVPALSLVTRVYASTVTAATKYATKTVTSINAASEVLTSTNHGYNTGTVVQITASTTMPGGINASTDYYVIRLTDNTFALATSLANAESGTKLNITSTGAGTIQAVPTTYSATIGDSDDHDGYIKGAFSETEGLYPFSNLSTFGGAYCVSGVSFCDKIYSDATDINLYVAGQAKTGSIGFMVEFVKIG